MRSAYSKIAALALAFLSTTPAVHAQNSPVVVELFTSQGCSSCPPADVYLGELANRDDVIALSLHVDYWDYLGWADQFASPEMTARQRAYAAAQGERSIYTPQMMIQGQVAAVGHQRAVVSNAIATAQQAVSYARVELLVEGGVMRVRITPNAPYAGNGVVQLVNYAQPQQQQIGRGENRGQTVTYHNVVTNWMQIGVWSGAEAEFAAPVPMMGKGAAVIVQDGAAGAILGAAKFER